MVRDKVECYKLSFYTHSEILLVTNLIIIIRHALQIAHISEGASFVFLGARYLPDTSNLFNSAASVSVCLPVPGSPFGRPLNLLLYLKIVTYLATNLSSMSRSKNAYKYRCT